MCMAVWLQVKVRRRGLSLRPSLHPLCLWHKSAIALTYLSLTYVKLLKLSVHACVWYKQAWVSSIFSASCLPSTRSTRTWSRWCSGCTRSCVTGNQTKRSWAEKSGCAFLFVNFWPLLYFSLGPRLHSRLQSVTAVWQNLALKETVCGKSVISVQIQFA